jgi:hypothetical protein
MTDEMTPPNQQPVPRPQNRPAAAPAPAAGPAATLSTEAQTLYSNFVAVDPTRRGVGLDKIRPFYPRVGWSVILGQVAELEGAGMLTSRNVTNDRGGVAYKVYTWKEA